MDWPDGQVPRHRGAIRRGGHAPGERTLAEMGNGGSENPVTSKPGFVFGRALAAALVGLTFICPAASGQAPARTPDIFFLPTLYSVADEMLKMAQVTANDVVYDL